jgi:hypothetical protein
MTTKSNCVRGLRYNEQLRNEAKRRYSFVVVGKKKSTTGYRVATKAREYLTQRDADGKLKHVGIIYNLKYYITGTDEDIRAAMTNCGYSESDIEDAVSGHEAVTAENVDEPNIAAMLQDMISESKRAGHVYSTDLRLEMLEYLTKDMKTYLTVVPNKESQSKPKKAAAKKNEDNLQNWSQQLVKSKRALDVSSLNSKGKGAKAGPIPSEKTLNKVYLEEFNISSTKEEGVRHFLTLTDREDQVDDALEEFNRLLKTKEKKDDKPKKEPSKAAPKARGGRRRA